jgi:hypothetical protein
MEQRNKEKVQFSPLLFLLLLLLLKALYRGGRKSQSNNTSQDEHTSMKRNKERNRHTRSKAVSQICFKYMMRRSKKMRFLM